MSSTSALRASALAFAILVLPAAAAAQLVIGPGPGGAATIYLIDGTTTRTVDIFDPLFLGGVSVTLGDVNGDGTVDVIGAAGPGGGPHVRVLSGVDFTQLASFFAYDPAFTGGVSVAAGDVNGDGHADIITGAGAGGGPHVIVYSGTDLSILASFFAYDPAFTGGVTVAAGDINGDGLADIVTGAGVGGGPHVEVFSGADLSLLASFFAYDPAFTGGVSVAAGDINGDGHSDIITGAGPGGGPHVEIFSGADLSVLESFFAYDPAFGGGVHVAAGDVNGDGVVDVILGAGPGGGPHVRILSGADLSELASFFAPGGGSGVSVGSLGDEPGVRFTSAAATSFLVGSADSFTITTAGNPPPAITSSGTLPAGVTFVDNGDGTATLAGTPAAATGGAYPLTFTADNGTGTPATQAFTLSVDEPPAITSPASATFPIGAAGSFTVTTSGFPLPAITSGGVSLPAGVTFVDNGDGTGTLSGTPAAGSGGTYAITFTATNSAGSTPAQAFTLTVNNAPSFTSGNTATFTVGSAGTFTVTAVGSPTPAISVTGPLPGGVTFVDLGTGSGTLSGTPAAATGGSYPIIFTATNTSGSATQSFTLNVNQAPAITSASNTTFTVGAAGSFTVTTSGFPPPAIARGGVGLPAGISFVDNADGTGTLSGTPAAGTAGTYAITFTATNTAGSSAPQAFTLTVNGPPAITSASTTTFTAGAPGTFTVTATGTPTPALSVSGPLPSGVTFLDNGSGTATLSGTPGTATGGSYALTFTASNGVLPNGTQAFTLVVNQAPAITSAAAATFTAGAAGSFTVTTSGFPLASLAIGGVSLPAGVAFVDNGNGTGTLSGTPAAGTGGSYAITFTATNIVAGTPSQAFTLSVSEAPAFTSANTTTFTVGAPGTFTVTASGTPPPVISFTGTLPSGVTFVDNGGGTATLSGTPAAGSSGVYALTFTAANGVVPDGTQAFTLNVNAAPAITSANNTTFTVGAAGSFTVTTSGFPLPSIALGGASLPAGVTFVDNGTGTGTLSGTPAAGTGGIYALTFTATNSGGSSPAQAFTLTVNGAPAITSANTVNFAVGAAGTFTVTTQGFPVPAIALGGAALPSGVTFTDNGGGTGTLAGTPAAGTGGSYAITFTATNSGGSSPVQAFTLTVTEALTITSANATTFLAGTPGSFTVTTTGFPVPTLTLTAGTLPAGVTFTDNGDGTATLSGTATATGVFTLEFTADNSSTPAVQSFTLTVNQAPTFTSANATTFTEDVPGTFTVTTQGTPPPALSFTGTLPAGVTFTDTGGGSATLAGTAAAGGTFPLTLSADNGVGSPVTQAFTLTVNEVNDAPSFVLAAAPPTVTEDAGPQTVAGFATLMSPGPANEAGQTLTFVVQNNSNTALFSLQPAVSATGTLTYTGGTNAFGTATITLVLQDNGGTANGGVNTSAPQMFTITVLPVNDPPLVVNETFQVLGNTELRVDMVAGTTPHTSETTTGVSAVEGVLDNDGDPEGDPFAVSGILNCTVPDTTAPFDCTLTGGAVVHLAANGEFSYTPAPGATTGSFTYTVTDTPAQGTAASVNGTVTFTFFDMIWYVDADAAAGGNGTSRLPFNTFAAATLSGAGGAGDLDDADDYIFVHAATAAIGAGIELEAGQHLISEAVGLSVPVNLNGNGSPTIVVTATGSAPALNGGAGNAVAITGAMAAEVRGFALSSTAADAIDLTTAAALTGSPTLTIADNLIFSAGANGIDVNLNAGTTGTLTLVVQANTWNAAATHAGAAVDINRVAGTLNLAFSSNTNITSSSTAVQINGGTVANTTITAFANNTIDGNTTGAGVFISGVTFDAVPGGGVEMVAGGVLTIGVSGNFIGGAGITLTTVQGSLFFSDLDVFAGNAGLVATGTGTGLALGAAGTSTISAVGGPAVNITLAAIALTLSGLSVTNTTTSGVALSFVSGTFSAPAGSTITKNSGGDAAFTVNNTGGGTTVLTATYAGTITNTSTTGGSVSVTSADAGSSVSFTGAITDNPGTGIVLSGNTGATVSFSGGLTLNGVSSRFAATGGGTVTVTGTNTIGATTAPSGPVLNVANTTIGASGMSFRSISANGGTNGIVLNTTGATAGLTVTGTGTGAAGTGGTIQNATSRGAEFISSSNITLRNMNFTNNGVGGDDLNCGDALGASINPSFVTSVTCESNIHLQTVTAVVLDTVSANDGDAHGINGVAVNGLTLTNVQVLRNGTMVGEDGVQLVNLTGTVNVTGGTFRDNASRSFEVQNNSGTPIITIDGAFFGNTNFPTAGGTAPSPANSTAASTVLFATNGTNSASISSTTRNSTFQNVYSIAFHVDMAGNTSQNVTFGQTGQGNTITTASQGITIVGTNSGGLTASVVDNTLNNDEPLMDTTASTNINFRRGGGLTPASGNWNVTIDNNDVGINGNAFSGCETAGCSGISADDQGSPSGTYTVLIQNNTVYRVSGPGIQVGSANAGAHTVNATVINNAVGDPEPNAQGAGGLTQAAGIFVFDGTATTSTTNARIQNNVVTGLWDMAGTQGLIRVRHGNAGATMNLCSYSGTTVAEVNAFLAAQNPGTLDPDGGGPHVIATSTQPIGDPILTGCPP